MIGESYGGGAQILGSIHDERLAALVPIATWYDLADGFAHGDKVIVNGLQKVFMPGMPVAPKVVARRAATRAGAAAAVAQR